MLNINIGGFEALQNRIKNFQGDAESVINEVLETEAVPLLQEEIKRLMPLSGRNWKGKSKAAKLSKSLTYTKSNLAVTILSTKKYSYLYYPDDGSTTRRHAGNQHFFRRAGEAKTNEIVDRCINRLVNNFEN